MQALGQCGDVDPVRPAGWADLLWWRRSDADGQRAGGQGGANASERQRACKDRVPRGDFAQSTNRSNIGGAVAYGNDGDDQMDSGAAPHGHLDLSQSPTVLETAGKRTMRCENTIILRTDPFAGRRGKIIEGKMISGMGSLNVRRDA